ncbi:MAG: KamA family protein [Bacteroidetes bacterium]|nr:KamA family protein [Bacteroidota bacterium]
MSKIKILEKVAISVRSLNILNKLLAENPKLEQIMRKANNKSEALLGIKNWVLAYFKSRPTAYNFYLDSESNNEDYGELNWRDIAAIRLMDYIDNAGRRYNDLNLRGELVGSNPIKFIWMAVKDGTGGAKEDFFMDMLYLFRQFNGKYKNEIPQSDVVKKWMDRHPTGLDKKIIKTREKNRDRIINILIEKIDNGELTSHVYYFEADLSYEQKYLRMLQWWDDRRFHLRFAIRSPKLLNELLDHSLDPSTMNLLSKAKKGGIPFFVNPYYLSLLNVNEPGFAPGADLAIRDYIIYSKELIEEFGHLVAWEREDIVQPGKPNIAGWILPSSHSVHRRYPEVAILVPDTVGRACGGLCVSCQRMYDFQAGNLNFNLDKLRPKEIWPQKLSRLLEYFEEDSQLRDILITGGDALMSTDKSLKKILNEIYEMAKRKIADNLKRAEGEKYAEMLRVRLGTRLPVYLPQRITPSLIEILKEFKTKASKIGIKQFFIQTHFQSAMEITPEARNAVTNLISAGWMVTNQLVFTVASSRRGHSAKLRKTLNDIGVIPYYTFSVKGYMENFHNFATNARAIQEQKEEKYIGKLSDEIISLHKDFFVNPEDIKNRINQIRIKEKLPFLAIDRNVLNLPGIGKSQTFRTIGITRDGRRILQFDHDIHRNHSPIISEMGKVIIIESKSIAQYLRQLEEMGESIEEYENIYGYSIGETEPVNPLYKYPEYDFKITENHTNFSLEKFIEEIEDL